MNFGKLILPAYQRSIKINHRGMNKHNIVIGCDTETFNGEPMTLQFYSNDKDIKRVIFCDKNDSFEKFVNFCNELPQQNQTYIMYALNLEYDLIGFLYSQKEQLIKNKGVFCFKYENWTFKGIFNNLVYCYMIHKNRRKRIFLIDISAFFKGSLEKLARIFCPEIPKLDTPKNLGEKLFFDEDKEFIDYALRDAEICYYIGKYINKLETEFDCYPSLSNANLASKIFKHKFLKQEIPLPHKNVIYASLYSYHGGKNFIKCNHPAVYDDVYSLDIISAYPHAMSLFPSFSNLSLYKILKGENIKSKVPDLGVYKIAGKVLKTDYPIIYNKNFKPLYDDVSGEWVTGFELNQAIKSNYFKCDTLYGFFYEVEKDKELSPFKAYTDYFFSLKDTETDEIKKYFYKSLLSSLYGKFIQTNKDKIFNIDEETEEINFENILEGKGLFQPFIASVITGHCRAYIHSLELKYQALHTSTDGILTQKKPEEKEGLGGLKIECKGKLLIMRNKLYILYVKEKTDYPSKIFKGWFIKKYALHGFRGDFYDLEKIYVTKNYEYEYTKVNKLRESLRRGLQVNKFEKQKAIVNI